MNPMLLLEHPIGVCSAVDLLQQCVCIGHCDELTTACYRLPTTTACHHCHTLVAPEIIELSGATTKSDIWYTTAAC
jgi:hypothetical protein